MVNTKEKIANHKGTQTIKDGKDLHGLKRLKNYAKFVKIAQTMKEFLRPTAFCFRYNTQLSSSMIDPKLRVTLFY